MCVLDTERSTKERLDGPKAQVLLDYSGPPQCHP